MSSAETRTFGPGCTEECKQSPCGCAKTGGCKCTGEGCKCQGCCTCKCADAGSCQCGKGCTSLADCKCDNSCKGCK